jgi:apolipoprotein N-acyltransferase
MNQSVVASARRRAEGLRFVRTAIPSRPESSFVIGSALLSVLSFPNFDLNFLAWISLTPLLLVILRAEKTSRAFVAGWLWGVVFFYGSCWWLTYPMIHYGQISAWVAYPLLLLPIMLVALFPALFAGVLSRTVQRFGLFAILVAPVIWVANEWLRYAITGQLWNALGYSQAFHPALIQTASKGGVYAVSFLLVSINVVVSLAILRKIRAAMMLLVTLLIVTVALSYDSHSVSMKSARAVAAVVAIQPNVPMDLNGDTGEMTTLLNRHLALTQTGLQELGKRYTVGTLPALVIWPESPMNFSYSRDPHLREVIGTFARTNHTSVLLNSLEPGTDGGDQNSAVMINEQGQIAARYDKIRLMPFGEYVPLPRWLPGASSVRSIVGEFKPGSSYTLMPLGALRAGVFICIEAAHPGIARNFTIEGANVLINISNDGYLGPTAVMRQHLANAVFRAVENDRDLLRVTNTGITAYIRANGWTGDETSGFQPEVKTWTISNDAQGTTFYSRHGDLFVYGCALMSLGIISISFMRRRFVQ